MHRGTVEVVQWSKSISGKIQDGGWRQNWRCLNGCNSAADRPISLNFSRLVQSGVPGATKWSGCTPHEIQKWGQTLKHFFVISQWLGCASMNFAWRPPKLLNVIRGNSAAYKRIFTNLVSIWTMGHKKLHYGQRAPSVKFKIGENPQTCFWLYRNNSAENRWIFTKLGTYVGNFIPDVTQCPECTRCQSNLRWGPPYLFCTKSR